MSSRLVPSCALSLALGLLTVPARAQDRWRAAASLGGDLWLHPDTGGQGFGLFDLMGRGVVAGGDLHAHFNSDTLQVSLERVPVGLRGVELSFGLRGELAFAGVLLNRFERGVRVPDRGFYASYLQAFAAWKYLPGGPHALELVASLRGWRFSRIEGTTRGDLVLPSDTWVFEHRARYVYWDVTCPGEEFEAQVLFPRVTGVSFGGEVGFDVRADRRPWGGVGDRPDPRNVPGAVILLARQWLRAGARLHPLWRIQVEQQAGWGRGEDDLTRARAGGMNPWVIPLPGLGWPAVLSERFVSAQLSLNVRPTRASRHELGLALAGGIFNDVERLGALESFQGGAGLALLADLRFGAWQVYLRAGWALPVTWLREPPHLGAFLAVGRRF